MRAACEACGHAQPVDWRPGDLCVACGQPVRKDTRCFWCVKWTPAAGKYCRHCAAAVLDPRLFGAARMLKDAGVDRFSVPKMIPDLDPEQVENFSRIYDTHAGVMNRHVGHVEFLQSFLHHKTWAEQLEEELIAQLPWPEERLKELATPMDPAEQAATSNPSRDESLALAKAISTSSPFQVARALAALVRLLLEDWEAYPEAKNLIYQGPPLRDEAALTLANWRVVYCSGAELDRYGLIDVLRQCPQKMEAAACLILMGDEEAQLPAEALMSNDEDVAFTAALAAGDIDRLTAAARDEDPSKRYAAAWKLIRLGHFNGVAEAIRRAIPDRQLELVQVAGYGKKPAPQLRDVLFELLESSDSPQIRKHAAQPLLQSWVQGDTMRIARAARGERSIYQALLQTAAIPPEDLSQLFGFLLDRDEFSADQWGVKDAAVEGRLPPDFVVRHWTNASQGARAELVKLAEMQLENYGNDDLHRFLVGVCFTPGPFEIQQQAWVSLFRWYGRSDHSRMGPLRIQAAPLTHYFGSVADFILIFTKFLAGSASTLFQDLFVREPLAKLLRYSETDVLRVFEEESRPALRLADALLVVMQDREQELMLRLAGIDFMAMIAGAPSLRAGVTERLGSLLGTDIDYQVKTALERIESSG